MNPVDIIIVVVIATIVGLAGWYIYKSKKSGRKCIGCPDGAACSGHCTGCSDSCVCKEES
jgi:hypothetical protein